MTALSAYVGLPYRAQGRDRDGVDCWGLLRLFYRDELGIDLPGFRDDYTCAGERRELDALIAGNAEGGPWRRVRHVRHYDGLLFRVGPFASHVAMAIGGGRMLHVHADARSVIQPIRTPLWRDRLVGIYRHEAFS